MCLILFGSLDLTKARASESPLTRCQRECTKKSILSPGSTFAGKQLLPENRLQKFDQQPRVPAICCGPVGCPRHCEWPWRGGNVAVGAGNQRLRHGR